jgi:nucleoside-diphosphate-sugar epimerase
MATQMKIGITGALGHIGTGLVTHLQSNHPDLELSLIDNMNTQRYGVFNSFQSEFSFFEIDARSNQMKDHLVGLDLIIHLAATTDASGTAKKPELIYSNNLEATRNVTEIASELGIDVIFPSSTSVYGSQISEVDENFENLNPQSPYAECKLQEEAFVIERKGFVLRLGTIHGVSAGMRFHTAVNKFCWQASWNQPITIWETALDQVRPYLALQDFYAAVTKIISNKNLFLTGQILNLVSQNTTPNQIVKTIQKFKKSEILLVTDSIMNQFSYAVSNSKAKGYGFEFHDYLELNIEKTLNFLQPRSNLGLKQ